MNAQQRLKLRREIAIQADLFYDEAQPFGRQAKQNNLQKRQIKNLENIAETALKVSDVLDYIKTQTGKHEDWRRQGFGPDLIDYVRQELLTKRNEICRNLDISPEKVEGQTVYLHLIRAFIRQVAAHYEYLGAGGEI